LGTAALNLFIENYSTIEYILVDPHKDNIAAIKAYQKCGFKEIARHEPIEEIWMIKKIKQK